MPGFSKPEPVDNPGGSDEPDYYEALKHITDLDPFIELANKVSDLAKAGRINDIRRALVTAFVKLKPQPTADAGELREQIKAYFALPGHKDSTGYGYLGGRGDVEYPMFIAEHDVDAWANDLADIFQHQADQLRRECEAEVVAAHKVGYNTGVYDFSNYFMDASIVAQRVPIMPHIAQELVQQYAPHKYAYFSKPQLTNQPTPQEGQNG